MPDPNRSTISATQVPALYNASPYITKYMLYHQLRGDIPTDSAGDSRMNWGLKLQPLILEQAAQDLALEVIPNHENRYLRRGSLGCTRDATIIAPDLGPGAFETKAVFDYKIWMQNWGGGKEVPKHVEIQLQNQILVGDGAGNSFKWGKLGVWVCGEMYYYDREPVPELWGRMEADAAEMLADVKAGREPQPFGSVEEVPWLNKFMPVNKEKVLDLSGDPAAEALITTALKYIEAKDLASANNKISEAYRAKLLAAAGDAAEVLLPFGASIKVTPQFVKAEEVPRKAFTKRILKAWVPPIRRGT